MRITHFFLQEGKYTACRSTCKGVVPEDFTVEYGPRLTGLVGELSGSQRGSRSAPKEFCQAVLGIPINCGGIEPCVDRVSQAILPYYEAIMAKALSCKVNFVDETSSYQHGVLAWLWVMVNGTGAFFSGKASLSKAPFEEVIGHWCGEKLETPSNAPNVAAALTSWRCSDRLRESDISRLAVIHGGDRLTPQ